VSIAKIITIEINNKHFESNFTLGKNIFLVLKLYYRSMIRQQLLKYHYNR